MKEIKLTKGYVALVSDKDYRRVSQFKWYTQIEHYKGGTVKWVRAARNVLLHTGKRSIQLMHRFIKQVTNPRIKVDHKDHNGLNNQRSNLRKSTQKQNCGNQKLRKNNNSGLKGVYWYVPTGKWCARITVNYKCINLGYFLDKLEAAKEYDKAATKFFGSFAKTNKALGLLSEKMA